MRFAVLAQLSTILAAFCLSTIHALPRQSTSDSPSIAKRSVSRFSDVPAKPTPATFDSGFELPPAGIAPPAEAVQTLPLPGPPPVPPAPPFSAKEWPGPPKPKPRRLAILHALTMAPKSLPAINVSRGLLVTNSVVFKSVPGILQQELHPEFLPAIAQQINDLGLIDDVVVAPKRARVLIVGEREMKALNAIGITQKQVEEIGFNNYLQYTIFQIGCVKTFQRNSGPQVVFLDVKAKTWDQMRLDIQNLYINKGGTGGVFVQENWNWHLTFGETNPGAVKDEDIVDGPCIAQTRMVSERPPSMPDQGPAAPAAPAAPAPDAPAPQP